MRAAALLAAAPCAAAAPSDAALGFRDVEWNLTHTREPLPAVRGAVPAWLDGTYFRGVPSRFPDQWMFNAMNTRHAFYFDGGEVTYSMRFVQSDNYNKSAAKAGGGPPDAETPNLGNMMPIPGQANTSFDTDIAFLQIQGEATGGAILGVGGVSNPNSFDRETLTMVEAPFQYDDDLGGPYTAPTHAHLMDGDYLHHFADVMMAFPPEYVVWQIPKGKRSREVIAKIPLSGFENGPRYQHMTAVTAEYYIMIEAPCYYPWPLPNNWGGFTWRANQGTHVRVINRQTGESKIWPLSENSYAVHVTNAFIRPNTSTLVVDYPGYPKSCTDVLKDTNVTAMRGEPAVIRETYVAPSSTSMAVRLEIPLDRPGETVPVKTASNFTGFDMQTIYYEKHNGRPYRYVYGQSFREPGNQSIYYDQIVKIDYDTGLYKVWSPEPLFSAFPGEAYFVPAPGAVAEDDGVLITVVLDGKKEESYLYILNATTMETISVNGPTPTYINHGYHGRFMPKGFNFN